MENRINYGQQAELLKALAHPVRLEIVHGLLRMGCRNVRCMEMRFENGCRVQAVMPETAASLIWEKKGSSLTGGSVRDVQGAPVMTAALEDGTAFGFALEGTYYAVFVPDMDEQRADEILSNMIWLY